MKISPVFHLVFGTALSVTTAAQQLGIFTPLEDRITQISKLVDNLRYFYRSRAQNLFFDISRILGDTDGLTNHELSRAGRREYHEHIYLFMIKLITI